MIGAVVVFFNPSIDEIRYVNTYKKQVDYLVIIDNSNEDNFSVVNRIITLTDNILYYPNQENLGLARAFNIGIDILKRKGCDWALLFDSDSKLGTNIISVYTQALKKYSEKQVAVFSPVHVFERSNNKRYQGYKKIEWSMTSGWLVNIDIFIKQNGFFEALFVDGLDMDYCFKSCENGYMIVECGEAVISHNPARTKSFLGVKYGIASPNRYYMQARQLIWCWKRYNRPKMLITYMYKWLKVIFLFPNKKEYVKNMKNGTKAGFALVMEYGRGKDGK